MDLFPSRFDLKAHIPHQKRQFPDFLLFRALMAAVYKGDIQPVKMLRHRLLCPQHKFLDQLRRRIALIGPDLQRHPLFVQDQPALREIKINGASLLPVLPQNRRKFPHFFKHRHKSLIFLLQRLIIVFQNPLYRAVTHPSVYPDHRFRDPIIHEGPVPVDLHQTA